jgi:DNA-binding MarR family transcriptional regulator
MRITQDIQFASDLRAVVARLIKKLRKESPTGSRLSLTERSTMALLHQHGELLPSELAAMEMITNQSMSQVLNHLSELGYIVRTGSETDKRKVNISLSTEGVNTLFQFRHERDEWLAKAISETCSPKEQELLKKAIIPLTKLVDFKG